MAIPTEVVVVVDNDDKTGAVSKEDDVLVLSADEVALVTVETGVV